MPRFDYECQECQAIFEEWDDDPACKHCGSKKIIKVFITPPATKSVRTKNMDDTIHNLVSAHGMTDFQNDPSRKHDPSSPMRISTLNPKKQISEQVAEGINQIRGPISAQQIMSMPTRPGQQKGISNIPVMDPISGQSFQQVAKANRSQRYLRQATQIVHSIDRNGNSR